jgi:hypothetical protein
MSQLGSTTDLDRPKTKTALPLINGHRQAERSGMRMVIVALGTALILNVPCAVSPFFIRMNPLDGVISRCSVNLSCGPAACNGACRTNGIGTTALTSRSACHAPCGSHPKASSLVSCIDNIQSQASQSRRSGLWLETAALARHSLPFGPTTPLCLGSISGTGGLLSVLAGRLGAHIRAHDPATLED